MRGGDVEGQVYVVDDGGVHVVRSFAGCMLFVISVKDERKLLATFFLAFRLSMYVSLQCNSGQVQV